MGDEPIWPGGDGGGSLPPSVVLGGSAGPPAWAASTAYAVNQLVTNGGTTYICTTAHTSASTFAADASAFQALGSATSYRGQWVPLTAYQAGDVVRAADGTLQAAKVAFTSGATFAQTNWYPVTTGKGVVKGSTWDSATLGNIGVGSHNTNVPTTTAVPGFNHVLIEAPERMQFVNAPRRGPGKSLRMECRSGDFNLVATNSDRCEVTQTGNVNADLFQTDDEIWLALSFYIDPNNPTVGGTFANFFQLFGQDIHGEIWPVGTTSPDGDTLGQQSGGSPPFSIAQTVAGTYFSINVRGGPKSTSAGQPTTSQDANGQYISGARAYNLNTSGDGLVPTTAGVWHDWLIHLKFSTGVDGVTQVWHRLAGGQFPDTPQVDDRGANVHTIGPGAATTSAPLPCYLEMGIYRATDASVAVRYYAGIIARHNRQEAEAFWGQHASVTDDQAAAPNAMNGAGPLALGGSVIAGTGTVTVVANRTRLVRWKAPKTGTVVNIDLFVQATSGNVLAGIYDTGDLDGTNYTKLGASVSTAAGTANTWQRIALASPVSVLKGRDYMLAVIADNATITFVRGIVLTQTGLLTSIPSGYYDTPGGAGAKLSVDYATGSFTLPTTVALSSTADSLVPIIAAVVT